MYYSQLDPQWKHITLGIPKSDFHTTIGTHGCLVTALANALLVNGIKDIDPMEVNNRLRQNNGFIDNLVVWGAVSDSIPLNIEYREFCRDYPAPIETITGALDRGNLVIVEIDRSNDEGVQNHWVTITYEDGGLHFIDPYDGLETNFQERYNWADQSRVITAIIEVSSNAEPRPLGPGKDAIIDATGMVYLRSGPDIGEKELGLLHPGIRVFLEPDSDDDDYAAVIVYGYIAKSLLRMV